MGGTASEIIDQQAKLAADRSSLDAHWREIAPLLLPRQDDFQKTWMEGAKRDNQIYDSTGPLALERFAAAMESMLTPRSSRWHGIGSTDDRINNDHQCRVWFDAVTDLLFRMRYSPHANFASQQHENYMGLGAFGTAVMLVEDMVGKGVRYKSSHIGEHYFMENAHGRIDIDYWKYKLTAYQAAQKFKEENLPPTILSALSRSPNQKFEFITCVRPNTDYNPAAGGAGRYPFSSFHVSVDGAKLMGTGGFKTFPFIISRYVTAPTEVYGRSPGMTALAEIKMINQLRKTDLRARHKAVDPPILYPNDQSIRRLNMQPNAMNPGTVTANGQPLVHPFQSGARIDVSNDALKQSRDIINDIFLVTLFQILVETPQMTATEVLQRAQEKGALLSPTMGRQQSEALGPMIEREMSILEDYGYFLDNGPLPMPQKLKEARGNYEIEYTSPLSRAQMSEEALGTERTIQAAIPLAQIDPSIMDNFDLDAYVTIMGDANGAPSKLFVSAEDKAAKRQAQQNKEAMASMVNAAPGVAGAIKDVAQAQSFTK